MELTKVRLFVIKLVIKSINLFGRTHFGCDDVVLNVYHNFIN